MKCPKCKTSELKKSSYNSPFFCQGCGGMWLLNTSNFDLNNISIENIDESIVENDHDGVTGLCPSGHGIMIRAKVEIDEPFYLEKCTSCGGIWFDKGEWHRIAENNLAEDLGMIWSKSWQRKQSQEKHRENFLNTNRKMLGEEIFNTIIELSEKLKQHPEKDRAVSLLRHEIK